MRNLILSCISFFEKRYFEYLDNLILFKRIKSKYLIHWTGNFKNTSQLEYDDDVYHFNDNNFSRYCWMFLCKIFVSILSKMSVLTNVKNTLEMTDFVPNFVSFCSFFDIKYTFFSSAFFYFYAMETILIPLIRSFN